MDGETKATISSRLAAELRQSILSGELAPGSKVNLHRLHETFGVSLSPMREAVSRLVADGLVALEDQRGFRITPVSRENLQEVTKMRADLETLALGYSIGGADIDWESAVLASLHQLNRTKHDEDNLEPWEAAHTDFHRTLIAGCKMPLMLNFCTVLHNLNDRYRRIFGLPQDQYPQTQNAHEQIAEAAVARKSDAAVALLRAHIEQTGAALLQRFEEHSQRTAVTT